MEAGTAWEQGYSCNQVPIPTVALSELQYHVCISWTIPCYFYCSHNWFHTDYNIVICYESYLSVMHSCFFFVFFLQLGSLLMWACAVGSGFDWIWGKSEINHASKLIWFIVHACKDGGKTLVPSVFPVSNDIVAVSSIVINFVVQILWQNVQAISACFALAKQLARNSDNNRVVTWVTSCMSITSAWDEDTNNWLSKQHNPSLINQFSSSKCFDISGLTH